MRQMCGASGNGRLSGQFRGHRCFIKCRYVAKHMRGPAWSWCGRGSACRSRSQSEFRCRRGRGSGPPSGLGCGRGAPPPPRAGSRAKAGGLRDRGRGPTDGVGEADVGERRRGAWARPPPPRRAQWGQRRGGRGAAVTEPTACDDPAVGTFCRAPSRLLHCCPHRAVRLQSSSAVHAKLASDCSSVAALRMHGCVGCGLRRNSLADCKAGACMSSPASTHPFCDYSRSESTSATTPAVASPPTRPLCHGNHTNFSERTLIRAELAHNSVDHGSVPASTPASASARARARAQGPEERWDPQVPLRLAHHLSLSAGFVGRVGVAESLGSDFESTPELMLECRIWSPRTRNILA